MKSIIIIEGPDGAGKTTLARVLSKKLQAPQTHHGSYLDLRSDQIARVYYDSIAPALNDAANVVLDRAWQSERVYGDVMRGGLDRLGPYEQMLERLFMSVPHVLVYLTAKFDTLWGMVESRISDEYVKRREAFERIYAGYETSMIERGALRFNRDDAQRHTPESVAEEVLRATDLCRPPPFSLGVIGNICGIRRHYDEDGPVLLVGDQASAASTTSYPFVNFSMGGCSYWFTQLLREAKVDEKKLMWVNAYHPQGVATDLKQVVYAYKPRDVVALGVEADRALTSFGIAHRTTAHPQYVKRFNKDPQGIINIIREVLG